MQTKYANVLCINSRFGSRIVSCTISRIVSCTRFIIMSCTKFRIVSCMRSRNVLCTKSRSQNVTFTKSKNVVWNKISRSELVSVHNYFIQIVLIVKWSSSLSLWCWDFIAQCRHLFVLCLRSHDLYVVHEYLWSHWNRLCASSWHGVMRFCYV